MSAKNKPLGGKAYGSIPHLPDSRLGPGDHYIHEGQARICLESARDHHDEIIAQEKLDGSCCAVAKVDGRVVALTRSGWPASTSRYELHHYFDAWVRERYVMFDDLLSDGERLVGEWMAMAHGTIYDPDHPGFDPFIVFDLLEGVDRAPLDTLSERIGGTGLAQPRLIHRDGPLPLDALLETLEPSGHGADTVEGAVYRVERRGEVDFLAKYVRHDKEDGAYLPNVSGCEPVWFWRPA